MGNALRRINASADEVVAAYRKAIEYDQGHREAHANLAVVLLDAGRVQEATSVVETLAKLDPVFPSLAFLRARIETSQMASTLPLPATFEQAVTAYAAGRHAETILLMKQALDSGVLSPHIRRTGLFVLANAFAGLGDSTQSRQYRALAEKSRRRSSTLSMITPAIPCLDRYKKVFPSSLILSRSFS